MEVTSQRWTLNHLDDVGLAKRAAREFAAALAFGPTDLARIEVVAAELASNVVKHAGGGTLEAARLPGEPPGLRLTASDRGPGIPDVARARAPGYSTAGTSGDGLATVHEFMDRVMIDTGPAGTRVEADKWPR